MQFHAIGINLLDDIFRRLYPDQARLALIEHVKSDPADSTLNTAAANKTVHFAIAGHDRFGARFCRRRSSRSQHCDDTKVLAGLAKPIDKIKDFGNRTVHFNFS
jgi:hypothetical protein